MEGERLEMSQRERDVLKVMDPVVKGKRKQSEAARLLGISVRQVKRLKRRLKAEGDKAVIHGLCGRPSNRRLGDELKAEVLELYQARYHDFGPTFAAEKLALKGLCVGKETLRRWLIKEGLWKGRRKRDKHRSRRPRRGCFGELLQVDGSPHDWLEGRGPRMALLVFIDDATSRIMARFYPAETTEAYMDLLERWIRLYGRPVAIYADKHSIFQTEGKEGEPKPLTQLGRALEELGIRLIPAGSPEAKGRVERSNGTAQDRLVKELRLAGVRDIEGANRVVKEVFVPWFNAEHTVEPESPNDAHRGLERSMDLKAILSFRETRTVARDYTIRHDGKVYQIGKPAYPGLREGKVDVERRRDGSMHIRFKGRYLEYERIEVAARPGALPPDPRSLSPEGIPADGKDKGRAVLAARPSAVHPASGRSGRTPAEPCLPGSKKKDSKAGRWRPAPDHPWRKRVVTSVAGK